MISLRLPQKQDLDQWVVQSIHVGIYLLLLLVAVMSVQAAGAFFVPGFANYFARLAGIGLAISVLALFIPVQVWRSSGVGISLFAVDAVLFFLLITKGFMTVSLILLGALLLVAAAGVGYGKKAALGAAFVASVGTSWALLVGPDLKTIQLFMQLALANFGYFVTAFVAGYFSEELKSQGQLLQDEKLLGELILENTPVGVFLADADGELLRKNPAGDRILSFGGGEGRKISELFPEIDNLRVGASEFQAQRQGELRIFRIQVADREIFRRHLKVIVVEDLTEMKRLEFSQRQSEKLAAVGQLAAGIAHEIRNPLTGISGSIQLLAGHTSPAESAQLSKIILKEIDRLNHLITEFLDFARPESPPADMVDLEGLVNEVVSSLKLDQVNGGDQTEWIFESTYKGKLRAHRDKLKQALLNILVNALQSLAGRPKRQIFVRVSAGADGIEILIRDSGCGMRKEQIGRIFEPFHTTKPKGTGLGLAITHKIIEGHSGRIFVESEVERGTEFRIILPARDAEVDKRV